MLVEAAETADTASGSIKHEVLWKMSRRLDIKIINYNYEVGKWCIQT